MVYWQWSPWERRMLSRIPYALFRWEIFGRVPAAQIPAILVQPLFTKSVGGQFECQRKKEVVLLRYLGAKRSWAI